MLTLGVLWIMGRLAEPAPTDSLTSSVSANPVITSESAGLSPPYPDAPAPLTVTSAPEPDSSPEPQKNTLPEGFVYITDILPEARLEIRYATEHNFTGQVVPGYLSDRASLTHEAAKALKKAADALKEKGCGIRVYDAYRPKQAVSFFLEWAAKPEDGKTKAEFYPDMEKQALFKLGYLAKKSAHSRGSTIDLTLFSLSTGENLDMGSPYDFLGPISNHGTTLITVEQTRNREMLKKAMNDAGFKSISTEWWHYVLINEPYPETCFDFPVE